MLVLESLEKSDAKVSDDLLGTVTFALSLFRCSHFSVSIESWNLKSLSSHGAGKWKRMGGKLC